MHYITVITSSIMPTLSHMAEILPASPIRKLVPFADQAKQRGMHVYHLNIGQPDIHTPPVAMQAIRTMGADILEYTHSAGNESYRTALADFYSRRGTTITNNDIIVTTGGSEALLFGMMACCNPDDEIIVPEPYYANYNSFAIEAGVRIVPVPSSIETNFALPPIADLEKIITPRTRAILICNPNNPTGYLYTQSEIETLKNLVLKHNIYLMADEVYSDFCYGEPHFSVLQLQGADDHVILFDSVSKRYSMCGARVGAIVSRNKQIIDAALRMGQARLCAPFVGQIAGEAATRLTPKAYFDAVKAEYKARRDVMIEALQTMPGVVCPTPRGAFYAVAELPVDNAENFAKWLLTDFSYENATVMLAPAQGFYCDGDTCPQNQVRLAYVLKLDDMRHAMKILSKALEAYPNRTTNL